MKVVLRREREPGESLVRCQRCGRVDIPLNEAEMWHYVRTGEGLGRDCPDDAHVPVARCKWVTVESA